MRITLPKFDNTNPIVRELLVKARAATTIGESAYFQRLAIKAGDTTK